MKLSIFFVPLVFIACHHSSIYSQSYTPFYLDDVKWTIERVQPVLGQGDGLSYWEIYTLNDTLINGITYRKVATKNLCDLFPDGQGNLQNNNALNTSESIFGGIREENKKVYFLKFDQEAGWSSLQSKLNRFPPNVEHLLYDFEVHSQDTIHFSDLTSFTIANGDTTFFTNNHFAIIVDEITPFFDHKRYEVIHSSAFNFPDETSTLIEGIGSSYGFFGAYDSFLTKLVCYSINGEVMYFEDKCLPCEGFVSTQQVQESIALDIFPNPSQGQLNIISQQNQPIANIEMIDSQGKVLAIKKYQNHAIQLDLSSFSSRLLFLKIHFENGAMLSRKIILE